MLQGLSIKKTAKEVGICIQTSYGRRHKILGVLNKEVPERHNGKVECNEPELPLSNKGERSLKRSSVFIRNPQLKEIATAQVVPAVVENNQTCFKANETKQITAKHLNKT